MKSSFGKTEKNQILFSQVPFNKLFLFANTFNILAYMIYTYTMFNQVNLYPWCQLVLVMIFSVYSLVNLISTRNLNYNLLQIQKASSVIAGLLHFVCAILTKIGFIEYYNDTQKTEEIICIFLMIFLILEIFIDMLNYSFLRTILKLMKGHNGEREYDSPEEGYDEESTVNEQSFETNDVENQSQIKTILNDQVKIAQETA